MYQSSSFFSVRYSTYGGGGRVVQQCRVTVIWVSPYFHPLKHASRNSREVLFRIIDHLFSGITKSRFLEPLRKTKIVSRNREFEISGVKITVKQIQEIGSRATSSPGPSRYSKWQREKAGSRDLLDILIIQNGGRQNDSTVFFLFCILNINQGKFPRNTLIK